MPLISIALCTCNGEAHLAEQLDSLLAQNYPKLEIVIVDDASDDGTVAIIKNYAGRDSRITWQRNDQRLGFVDNFQKCLRLCRGEFMALCDQDDVWRAHKVSTLARAIGGHDLVYSRVRVVAADGSPRKQEHPRRHLLDGHCPLALVLTNFVTGHACMIRKDLLQRALPVPEGLIHDQWLAFCAACTESGLAFVDEALSDYRLHGDNQILGNSNKRTRPSGLQPLQAFASHPQLAPQQARLIRELEELLASPFCLYHVALHRFLKRNPAVLAAYRKPDRVRRKLCLRRITRKEGAQ